jgi:hypothetical protein
MISKESIVKMRASVIAQLRGERSRLSQYLETCYEEEDETHVGYSKQLGEIAASIVHYEGQLSVFNTVVAMQENGRTDTDVSDYLFRRLLEGADDAWSGRGNDMKRSCYDGVRCACRKITGGL